MSSVINIDYVWNKKNVEKLFESSYTYQFNHSVKRYIGWLFIAILQFGVVAAMKKGSIELLLFASIVLFYWYYGKKIIAKKRALNSYESSPFKESSIHIEVTDDGFKIENKDNKTLWSWNEIDEIIALGEDILLYKEPYSHYIPASAFASLEDKNKFKKIAREHQRLRRA